MIKKDNIRLMITLSKSQYEWLENFTKKHNISKSIFIKLILVKKAKELASYLKLEANNEKEIELIKNETEEDLEKEEDLINELLSFRKKIKNEKN